METGDLIDLRVRQIETEKEWKEINLGLDLFFFLFIKDLAKLQVAQCRLINK